MKKIKIMPSALIMLLAMLVSDRASLLILYFLSAGAHEMGHLVGAKALGIGISEIRITYSGMRICTEKKLISYKRELFLAAAGPLANLAVIAVTASAFALLSINFDNAINSCIDLLFNNMFTISGAFGFIMLSSFVQGAINLLPVRTFDGGRIMYCLLSVMLGERAAGHTLDMLSALSAALLWIVALYLMLRISSGVGIYAFSACLFFCHSRKNSDSANVSQ